MPFPLRWGSGMGFAPDVSVVPHYDAWPEPFSALIAFQAPRGSTLGIDEDTYRGRGPRRWVAGPRRVARDGLARSPPGTLPRRRGVSGLVGGPEGPGGEGGGGGGGLSRGRIVRKQSSSRPGGPSAAGTDLRLVAARRADHREVLPVGPLDAALVAARATDIAHVVAAFSRARAGWRRQLVQRLGSDEKPFCA